MQMTTREAVREALKTMGSRHNCSAQPESKNMWRAAGSVLCEHYGFKLEQFFDVEEAA